MWLLYERVGSDGELGRKDGPSVIYIIGANQRYNIKLHYKLLLESLAIALAGHLTLL